jgi:hypothetical protein
VPVADIAPQIAPTYFVNPAHYWNARTLFHSTPALFNVSEEHNLINFLSVIF